MNARTTIRPIADSDLEQVVNFDAIVFGEDRWSREEIEATIAHPDTCLFVAEVESESGTQFAGYCALFLKGSRLCVTTIGVDERFRRIGVGRAMMETLMDAATGLGASSMHLNLRTENYGAKKLYESLGFKSVGIIGRFYESDGADAETMELNL